MPILNCFDAVGSSGDKENTMIKPQVKIEMLAMDDPTFEAGSVKTARAQLTNPTAREFSYTIELYLGIAKIATTGPGAVTIGAGQTKTVSFTLTMPVLEGEYPVFLDVKEGADLIAHYQATENVVIHISPAIEVGPITWE
ncbi:MAG: hypothetical protein PHQ43_07090 [Dehalococcoidales bacterium]|nr:hypothetical protein [Dehalococcoidales bacterium]